MIKKSKEDIHYKKNKLILENIIQLCYYSI